MASLHGQKSVFLGHPTVPTGLSLAYQAACQAIIPPAVPPVRAASCPPLTRAGHDSSWVAAGLLAAVANLRQVAGIAPRGVSREMFCNTGRVVSDGFGADKKSREVVAPSVTVGVGFSVIGSLSASDNRHSGANSRA